MMNINWLISYNHSGNGWVRYCIEYLTGLPTHGHQPFSMSERKNNFLDIDLTKPPIVIKRHEIDLIELKKDDNLLLLLRNPFDAIKAHKNITHEFNKYYELIKIYEIFNGNKKIVLYDDLFKIKTIDEIINFFNLKINNNKRYLLKKNFKYHANVSRSIHQNKQYQKGSELKEIDVEFLKHVNKYFNYEKITIT